LPAEPGKAVTIEPDEIDAFWDEVGITGNVITKGAGDLIDGIKITDGKVGGKIPVDEFKTIRYSFDGYKISKYHDVIFQETVVGIGFKTHLKSITD